MQIQNLDCEEFDTLRAQKNCLVIDVRERAEFELGHIPQAHLLPLSTLSDAEIPVAQTVILYCQSGYRSKVAAEFLVHQIQNGVLSGIEQVMHLKPGYRVWAEKQGD